MFGFLKKVFKKKVTDVATSVSKKVLEKKISEKDLENILEDLEMSLLEGDVAFEVSEKIKDDLKKNLIGKQVKRGKVKDIIIKTFKDSLSEILDVPKIDFGVNMVLFARNTQFYNSIRIGKVNVKNGVAEVLAMETMSAMPIEDKVSISLVVVSRKGIKSIRTPDGLIVVFGVGGI